MKSRYELWIAWGIYQYPLIAVDNENSESIQRAIESLGYIAPDTTYNLIEVKYK